MSENGMLNGRWALVTGATRGIGRATAQALAEAGCAVAVTSRTSEDCRAVADDIRASCRVPALGAACDVARAEEVRSLFEKIRAWSGGRLDILVCNAGYPFLKEVWSAQLHDTPAGQLAAWYRSVFETDAMGSVFCTREALPLMMAQQRGSIIYISSTPALEGFQGTPYTMAKAAILGLMRDVAFEYGKYHIRANALALGNIATPATLVQFEPGSRDRFVEDAPLRRWGTAEEVAQAILFLASDASSYVTGQTLVVDGGLVRR